MHGEKVDKPSSQTHHSQYWLKFARVLNDRASAAGTFEVAKANIYIEAFPFGKLWNHIDC